MRTSIQKLARRAQLWILTYTEIGQFEGIALADLKNPPNQNSRFQEIILAALHLLKATDPCRYARVRRRLAWITNSTLDVSGSAEYRHGLRWCTIDFVEPGPEDDLDFLAGRQASILVHEATHGEIESRGVPYTPKHRSRIEHLCVKQEQKFIQRLANTHPDLATSLYHEFDASNWESFWNTTR